MSSINWTDLQFGVTTTLRSNHKQRDCIVLAVKGYEDLPWFTNTSRVAPAFDIFSYEGNLASFFEHPHPITITDTVAVSRVVVACLQFLRRKRLALRIVDDTIFCEGDEEYICKLSPTGQMMGDQDGRALRRNMGEISLLTRFRTDRMQHALTKVKRIEDLDRHPVTWDHVKDSSLLLDFMTYASRAYLDLNHLIKTSGADGKLSWAIDPDVLEDSLVVVPGMPVAKYKYGLFRDLIRYLRNRIAHYGEGNPKLVKRFPTPDLLIKYFNESVIGDGDLVFSLWKEINDKRIRELPHYLMECD